MVKQTSKQTNKQTNKQTAATETMKPWGEKEMVKHSVTIDPSQIKLQSRFKGFKCGTAP